MREAPTFAAAISATSLGARVALIERGTVGRTCVNVGCIQSKHLLAASNVYRTAGDRPFKGVGTQQTGVDFPAPIAGKGEVVDDLANTWAPHLTMAEGLKLTT